MRESQHFGKPRPAACNLTSAISRAFLKEAKHLICQSGECERRRRGSKINEGRFIQVYDLCPLILIWQRCVVNKAASRYGVLACTQLVNKRLHISLRPSSNALSARAKPQADYCQAYPMIFRLFCNAATRLLTCRSSNAWVVLMQDLLPDARLHCIPHVSYIKTHFRLILDEFTCVFFHDIALSTTKSPY